MPAQAWLIFVTAVGFACKIPFAIVIGIGLLGTPLYLISAVCGTFTFYMVHIVKISSTSFKGEAAHNLLVMVMKFVKQFFSNKEMILMMVIVIVCGLLVYG